MMSAVVVQALTRPPSTLQFLPMALRIAVLDPLPVFRQGIIATLGGVGFATDAPEDLLAWVHQEQRHVVLLTLQGARDWSLLAELRRTQSDVLVVAVLVDTSVRSYVQAIVAGAVTAIPRDSAPETVRAVLEAALAGRSTLPIEVIRMLASSRGFPEGGEEVLPPTAIDWLRALAGGATVTQLAERVGYSERAMYRQLRQLYARLGAKNRTQALMLAQERGWI
jgi:DNA-binding NarL/FixJ family response regulator